MVSGAISPRAARLHAAEAEPDVVNTIHFDTVRFPPPPWALEAFAAAARDGSLAYGPYRGSADVRAVLAGSLGRLLGVSLDPETELVITAGTQAGLFTSLAAVTGTGRRVLLADPDYLDSAAILRFLGATVTRIPLVVAATGLQPDLDALEAELRAGPAVFVFSHPNNPTGAVYPAAVIERIAALLASSDSIAVVDELYARLTYDGPLTHLAAQAGMADRCITLLGPSKTELMSGYRLGVVVGPAPLLHRVEELVAITTLRAPAYAQHVLRHWLVDDEAWLAARQADLRALRDATVARLRAVDWLRLEPPAGAAYVFPNVSALRIPDDVMAERLLDEARVLVIPGDEFGPHGAGHFRMCFARDEAQWSAALDRVVEVLAGLG